MKKNLKKQKRRTWQRSSNAPAMIVFCAFEQIPMVINEGKRGHGLVHSPLIFYLIKKLFSTSIKSKYENS